MARAPGPHFRGFETVEKHRRREAKDVFTGNKIACSNAAGGKHAQIHTLRATK